MHISAQTSIFVLIDSIDNGFCMDVRWLVGWLIGFKVYRQFRIIQCQIKILKIQFNISIVFVYKQLNLKTVLFQTIQFSINRTSPSDCLVLYPEIERK